MSAALLAEERSLGAVRMCGRVSATLGAGAAQPLGQIDSTVAIDLRSQPNSRSQQEPPARCCTAQGPEVEASSRGGGGGDILIVVGISIMVVG